jgi:hypothetical protein
MKCKFKKVRTIEGKERLKAQVITAAWIVVTPALFCAAAIAQTINKNKETK